MKITGLQVRRLRTVVAAPLPPRGDVGYSTYHHTGSENQSVVTVELTTDAGPTGLTSLGHSGPDAVRRIAERFGPALLAADPQDVQSAARTLRSLCRQSADDGIVNYLEFALWDLLGKARVMPLFRLLGGSGSAGGVRVYASSLYFGTLDGILAQARRFREQGFRALKVKIGHGPQEDLELVRAVREAVGPDVALLVDANRAYDLDGALRLCEGLAALGVTWFEEPFPYAANAPAAWTCDAVDEWGIGQYRELREATKVPIAGAEGFRDLSLIGRLLDGGCLDVLQPDTAYMGLPGMLDAIELARQAGVTPSPHACCDAMGLLVSLHLQALTGNPAPQEYETFESPFVQELFAGQRRWLRADGSVAVPAGPGLGVEFDPETCARYCVERETLTP